MAENDKLELNFKELARNATDRVFGSVYPALQSMLKNVKEASEANKAEQENLYGALEQISSRIGEINTGLKKLNDSMSKALGFLGKVIDAVKEKSSGGGGSSVNPRSFAGGNIRKAATSLVAGGGMLSLLNSGSNTGGIADNLKSMLEYAPGVSTSTDRGSGSTERSAPTGERSQTDSLIPQTRQQGTRQNQSESPQSSNSFFDAIKRFFGGGQSEKSSPSRSQSTQVAAPSVSGSSQQPRVEKASLGSGGASRSSQGGSQNAGPSRDMSEAIVSEKGGMTTLKTRSDKTYTVSTQYAPNFFGMVDELEAGGYKIDSIGGLAARSTPSWHPKGMAIDINPSRNPVSYKGEPGAGKTDMPSNINQIVAKHNVGWGGNWIDKKLDTMHFSVGPNEYGDPKVSEAMRGGGNKDKTQIASAGGGSSPAAAPVEKPPVTTASNKASAPLGAQPSGETPAATPQSKTSPATATGSQLNRESVTSEVASVTPPARASMNTVVNKNPSESENLPNPKLANANEAGPVEPSDAKNRYKELFGLDPRVPTGSTSRAA